MSQKNTPQAALRSQGSPNVASPSGGASPSPVNQRANQKPAASKAGGQQTAGKPKEAGASNYFKYLKFNPGSINIGGSDKNYIWYPTEAKETEGGPLFNQVELLKEDDKNFTVLLPDNSQKVLSKEGKNLDKNYLGVNRPKYTGVEDNSELPHLNEAAVLFNLKSRYASDLFHTYSGLFLVVINPYKLLPIYTQEFIELYTGKSRDKVAPHIFAISDEAYRSMLSNRKNQSLLITGESGAGKTENTKRVIQYLAAISSSASNDKVLENQLLEFNPILEAFGNAKTIKNNNSSRFGKFIELQFNSGGQICGANTLIYLLEKSRVVGRAKNERSFHIFYQMMHLEKALKDTLEINSPENFELLRLSECYKVDRMDDAKELQHSIKAFDTLKISQSDRTNCFEVLAAILHLGNLPIEDGKGAPDLTDMKAVTSAARLLGTDAAKLKNAIVAPTLTVPGGSGTEKVAKQLTKVQAQSTRDALCRALYGRLFLWVVRRINDVLSHPDEKDLFLGVLDISGFEIFKENSFEQLCINYTNEKLQQFFNNHMFRVEQEEYEREQIGWSFMNFGMDLQGTIDLIDKEPNGILIMLDDENALKGANDTSFTKKVQATHESHRNFRKPQYQGNSFSIIHYAGTVTYTTEQWLDKNRDPLENDLQQLMKDSEKTFVRGLFDPRLQNESTATPTEGESPAGGRKAYQAPSTRKKGDRGAGFTTVAIAYKEQLSQLMEVLRDTYPHFVRCIIPNHKQIANTIDDRLVLEQLRCNGVLEGIRIARLGWPNRLKYGDFLKRYALLRPGYDITKSVEPKQGSKDLCDFLIGKFGDKVNRDNVRFGNTKIFFRSGQLAAIEQMREQIISKMVISVQACSRAYIARRAYYKSHEQEFAARKIQKFVRAWIELRNWGWWKVYLKGRNLYSQRNYQAEIDELEAKIKAIEEQIKKATEQRNILRKQKGDIDLDLKEFTADMEKLKSGMNDLTNERGSLSKVVEGLRKEVGDIEKDLDDETARVNTLLKAKQELLAAKATFEASLEDEMFKGKAAADAKKRVEDERDDAKSKAAEEGGKAEYLEKKLQSLESDLEGESEKAFGAETNVTALRNKLRNDEKALAAAEEELNKEAAERGVLDRSKKELDSQLAQNAANIEGVKADMEAAEAAMKRSSTALEAALADLEDTRSRATKSDRSEKESRARLKELEEQVENERILKEKAEKDRKALETRVGELEAQRKNLETDKNTSGETVKNAKSQLEESTRKLEEAEALVTRLRNEKKTHADELADIETALEAEVENGRKDKRRLTAKVQELQDKLNNAPKGDANAEDLKKLEEQLKDVVEDLAAADKARNSSERLSSQSSIELEDLRTQMEDLSRGSSRTSGLEKRQEADLKEVKETLESERAARASLEEIGKRLATEADELRKKLGDLAMGSAAGSDTFDYKRENRQLKKELGDLDRENRSFERELRSLKEKTTEATYTLDQERKTKDNLANEAKELKARFVANEKAGTTAVGKILAENEEEIGTLNADINDLETKNRTLKERIIESSPRFDVHDAGSPAMKSPAVKSIQSPDVKSPASEASGSPAVEEEED